MLLVFPGVEPVFAIFVFNRAFMSEDFPTFERPATAISGRLISSEIS